MRQGKQTSKDVLIAFTYLYCTYTDFERTKRYLETTINHYIHVIDILNFLIHLMASLDISDFLDIALPHNITSYFWWGM